MDIIHVLNENFLMLDAIENEKCHLDLTLKIQDLNLKLRPILKEEKDKIIQFTTDTITTLKSEYDHAIKILEEQKGQVGGKNAEELATMAEKNIDDKITKLINKQTHVLDNAEHVKKDITDPNTTEEIDEKLRNLQNKHEKVIKKLEQIKNTMGKEQEEIKKYVANNIERNITAAHKIYETTMSYFTNIKKNAEDNMGDYYPRPVNDETLGGLKSAHAKQEDYFKIPPTPPTSHKSLLRPRDRSHDTFPFFDSRLRRSVAEAKSFALEKINKQKKLLEEVPSEKEGKKDVTEKFGIKESDIKHRIADIDSLDKKISELDREIMAMQIEHKMAAHELEEKKDELRKRVLSLQQLDTLLDWLTNQMHRQSLNYEEAMNELLRNRSQIMKRTDLTDEEKRRLLEEIDLQVANLKHENEKMMSDLEEQRNIIKSQSRLRESNIESYADEMNKRFEEQRRLLEEQMLHASPSERLRLQEQLKKLEEEYEAEKLKIRQFAEKFGMSDAERDESDEKEMHSSEIGFSANVKLTESMLTQVSMGSSSSSASSIGISKDTEYLKTAVGVPLSLALAEITAKQPTDPIHYLAHWLIKYRYNQEIEERKKAELDALIAERDRLYKELRQQQLELKAYGMLLEMIDTAIFEAEENYRRRRMLEEMAGEGEYGFDGNLVDYQALNIPL